MPMNFRQSRFRGRQELGEDINPSAYIVNLADCMLVLACGFMVAMITFWNIDVTPAEQLEQEDLEAVDPATLPEDIGEGGSYYVEAGTVYQDPNTGELYMVQNDDASSSSSSDAAESSSDESSASSASSASAASTSSAGSDQEIRNARAAGAD